MLTNSSSRGKWKSGKREKRCVKERIAHLLPLQGEVNIKMFQSPTQVHFGTNTGGKTLMVEANDGTEDEKKLLFCSFCLCLEDFSCLFFWGICGKSSIAHLSLQSFEYRWVWINKGNRSQSTDHKANYTRWINSRNSIFQISQSHNCSRLCSRLTGRPQCIQTPPPESSHPNWVLSFRDESFCSQLKQSSWISSFKQILARVLLKLSDKTRRWLC